MEDIFSRNKLFWGDDFQKLLSTKNIFVFGLGGVGGFALESLARCGFENFTIVDFDTVNKTNINRQIIALHSTIDKKKTEIFQQRLLDINPNIKLRIFEEFYTEELNSKIFNIKPDFVIDAIDTMKAKIQLLKYCNTNNIETITSLGAGNRVDPTQLKICDISEIKNPKCPFMKNVLKNLKNEGIEKNLTVIISDEKPTSKEKILTEDKISIGEKEITIKKITPASTPFVPAVCGYYMAWCIISKLLK